jgi:ELWxxDGT repeat protein
MKNALLRFASVLVLAMALTVAASSRWVSNGLGSNPRSVVPDSKNKITFNASSQPLPSSVIVDVPALVKDINPGPSGSMISPALIGIPPRPFSPVDLNGTLFFRANDGANGIELWRSDGTAAGTVLFKDIVPGSGSSDPRDLIVVDGILLFRASDAAGNRRLWRSDGTEVGTFQLGNLIVGTSDPPVEVGGTLFFAANDGVTGIELWRSDGTLDGTVLVKDITPGFFGSGPASFEALRETLFFVASDETGRELWRSDGTAPGTFRVKDIFPFSSSSAVSPDSMTAVGDLLFFRARDGVHTTELWRSDGTEAGTFRIPNVIAAGPNGGAQCAASPVSQLADFGGILIFAGTTNDGSGSFELWRSDGTESGTFQVKDIFLGSNASFPHCFTEAGGTLYFVADHPTTGIELWRTDGTEAGTFQVKDIDPSSSGSSPTSLTNALGTLYFSAGDALGNELWRSDGTDAGTFRVADINPTGTSRPENLVVSGGKLFFSAENSAHGRELWCLELNQAPTASEDTITTNEDTAITINVLANDTDPENQPLTLTNFTQGANGSVAVNADNTVTYTPAPNFFGADTFTYTINDTHGGTATGTVKVTVNPINDAPLAFNGVTSLDEDTHVEITLVGEDIDSASLNFVLMTATANGTLSPVVGNKVIYTPDPNYTGPDSFTFIANDGTSDSNVAEIMIAVLPIPDAPLLATVGNQVVAEGSLLSFTLSGTDPDGEQLTFSASGLPGGATLDPTTGAFSWTPDNAQAGTYTVTFTVTDPTNRSATETITITVTDVSSNLGPVCSEASPSIGEIWPPDHRMELISVFGITDPDNDPITITIRRILQDEPTDTNGDGTTAIDGLGVGTSQVRVRAERSGRRGIPGNGRVYEIFFEASDGRGKSCTGSIKVGVPHNEGRGPAVDDGKRYDSTVAGGSCLNCNP